MWKVRAALPALVLALVVACAQPSRQLIGVQNELATNRQQWEAVGLIDYRFTFERSCFCPPEFSPRVTITVKNRAVESVRDAESGEVLPDPPYSYTVDDLFDIIQEAIDEAAVEVRAEYNAELGYPVDVYIDTYATVIDEEYSMKIRDFTELPIGPQ